MLLKIFINNIPFAKDLSLKQFYHFKHSNDTEHDHFFFLIWRNRKCKFL